MITGVSLGAKSVATFQLLSIQAKSNIPVLMPWFKWMLKCLLSNGSPVVIRSMAPSVVVGCTTKKKVCAMFAALSV